MRVFLRKRSVVMRAVDTNVLVRYLAQDEAVQSARAVRIVEGGSIFVAKTVLLELEWVMRSVYKRAPAEVIRSIEQLCGLPTVTVEDAQQVATALTYAQGGFDLADALHAVSLGPARSFVTFDSDLVKKARKLGLKLVSAAQ